jgi:AcrR family transcriptional regulator
MARASVTPVVRRDEQRLRVLSTAAGLFARSGFDAVTMADIAGAAGVARATVFNYFKSKHAIVEAITLQVLDAYRDMLAVALTDDTTNTAVLLRQLCADMATGIEAQRKLHRKVFAEIARVQFGLAESDVAQHANANARRQLVKLIARGQQRGELSSAFTADALADVFHAITNGTITNWLFGKPTRQLADDLAVAADVLLSPIEQVPARKTRKSRP